MTQNSTQKSSADGNVPPEPPTTLAVEGTEDAFTPEAASDIIGLRDDELGADGATDGAPPPDQGLDPPSPSPSPPDPEDAVESNVVWRSFDPGLPDVGDLVPSFVFGGEPGTLAGVVGSSFGSPADQPDSKLDFGDFGQVSIRAATVRGRSHRYMNEPRQDDYAVRSGECDSTKYLCIAVCDGISSGKMSHLASRLIARTAVDALAEAVNTELDAVDWSHVIRQANDRVLVVARRRLGLRDSGREPTVDEIRASMSTTLVLALITVEPPFRISGISIGDSSCWMILPDRLDPMTSIKNLNNDIASSAVSKALPTEPTSVTSDFITPFGGVLVAGEALFITTDGIGDPVYDGTTPVAKQLGRHWSTPPEPYTFASQVNFASAGHDDDRTAVAVWIAPDQPNKQENQK